jgi:hypothetical protein
MKSIKLTSIATLLAVSLGTVVTTAHAADVATYDSKGSITYQPSTDPTSPVDPTDPTNPVTPIDPTDPTKPVEPGTPGPLSIDFASSFDFGTQKITSTDQVYNAASQKYTDAAGNETTGPNYVQVTDNRGTIAGWSLSVTQGAQFSTGGTGVGTTLDGAQMILSNGNIKSASATPADKYAAITPLVPGTQSGTILGATKDNGAGTNLLDFGTSATADSSVKLNVPGATTKLAATYTTDLTWTLSDTPAS